MRVLVVEDAPRLLEILARSLREEGFVVDGAPTGEEALRLAAIAPYDAIVLDIRSVSYTHLTLPTICSV